MTSDFSVYDQIFNHITQVSFGQDIYTNESFLESLRKAIPLMDRAISSKKPGEVNVKIATDIAMSLVGEGVNRLKKEDERRLCFEATFVMLFALKPENEALIYKTNKELVNHYPEFAGIDEVELSILLSFRNVMRVAQEIISPKYKKGYLLDIVTRISEGRSQKYITGSGETLATKRRVLIYQREGNIQPKPRPPRRTDDTKKRRIEESGELSNDDSSDGNKKAKPYDDSAIRSLIDILSTMQQFSCVE